ncbi:hypothetical protein ACOMHN_046586 [Nucella lapillus]
MKMAAGDAITCTAVTTRLSTHVTCHFGFDVSKNKRDMNVQFFYPDMTVRAETPLMCNYDGTDNLKCLLGKDVIFDRNVSDDISFTRPPAGDKVGGQYVCQVAPPLANTDIVPCKLTFIDIPTEPPTIPELLPQGNDDDDSDYLGAVAHVFLLLIITAVIVVCVLFYIRRERIRKWCSGPIRQNWPGATGDPEELETAVKASAVEEGGSQGESLLAGDSPEDSVLQEIPQGLPQFFFKKGWTDRKARAEREMEAKSMGGKTNTRQFKSLLMSLTIIPFHKVGDMMMLPERIVLEDPVLVAMNLDPDLSSVVTGRTKWQFWVTKRSEII